MSFMFLSLKEFFLSDKEFFSKPLDKSDFCDIMGVEEIPLSRAPPSVTEGCSKPLIRLAVSLIFLVISYFFTVQFFAMIGLAVGLFRTVTFFVYENKNKQAPIAWSFLFSGLTIT